MKPTVDSCIATADNNGVAYKDRLRRIRESSGKKPEEIARQVGITIPRYYDFEDCDGELNSAASLDELSRLAAAITVPVSLFFEDRQSGANPVSQEQLRQKIEAHLRERNMSLAEFEDRAGFLIGPALRDSSEILKWNVDCLRCVCKEIGIDWLATLP